MMGTVDMVDMDTRRCPDESPPHPMGKEGRYPSHPLSLVPSLRPGVLVAGGAAEGEAEWGVVGIWMVEGVEWVVEWVATFIIGGAVREVTWCSLPDHPYHSTPPLPHHPTPHHPTPHRIIPHRHVLHRRMRHQG